MEIFVGIVVALTLGLFVLAWYMIPDFRRLAHDDLYGTPGTKRHKLTVNAILNDATRCSLCFKRNKIDTGVPATLKVDGDYIPVTLNICKECVDNA